MSRIDRYCQDEILKQMKKLEKKTKLKEQVLLQKNFLFEKLHGEVKFYEPILEAKDEEAELALHLLRGPKKQGVGRPSRALESLTLEKDYLGQHLDREERASLCFKDLELQR